jgi:hypothetical protein
LCRYRRVLAALGRTIQFSTEAVGAGANLLQGLKGSGHGYFSYGNSYGIIIRGGGGERSRPDVFSEWLRSTE